MSFRDLGCERRFGRYLDGLAAVVGHADRIGPLRDYCTGLMRTQERGADGGGDGAGSDGGPASIVAALCGSGRVVG